MFFFKSPLYYFSQSVLPGLYQKLISILKESSLTFSIFFTVAFPYFITSARNIFFFVTFFSDFFHPKMSLLYLKFELYFHQAFGFSSLGPAFVFSIIFSLGNFLMFLDDIFSVFKSTLENSYPLSFHILLLYYFKSSFLLHLQLNYVRNVHHVLHVTPVSFLQFSSLSLFC